MCIRDRNGEKDYYISFAFHYYSLIYCRFMKTEDPKRCINYENRARLFAKDFISWFAEDGSSLAYGRSLTYRFAQVSFFSMCVACELEVVPYAVMKGLIARHLDFWMKYPIFDTSGLLTIGYGYSNLLMSEQYNAPGSPYWLSLIHISFQVNGIDTPIHFYTNLLNADSLKKQLNLSLIHILSSS